MNLTVRQFEERDSVEWDRFCGESLQGTFLHTRRFLSYHGERFDDRSLIVEQDGRWAGIFPAARTGQASMIISHPGITYGGVLHRGVLFGSRMIAALEGLSFLQKMPVKGKYAVSPKLVGLATSVLASTIV